MNLNQSQRHKVGGLLMSLAVFGLFQNFDFASVSINKVDQASRSAHSKELLGRRYRGSSAQKAEKANDLHLNIQAKLYENLPPNYKERSTLIAKTIIEESEFYDFDPVLIMAMMKTESKFNPEARGSHGEIGLLQIKPDTAEWIAEREGLTWTGPECLENPVSNVKIGMAYVNYLRTSFEGSANKYLSAYNMGARNVRKLYANELRPHQYSLRVMKNYQEMYAQMAVAQASSLKKDFVEN